VTISPDRAEWTSLRVTRNDEEFALGPRLRPVQQRARDTVQLILNSAAELLEKKGFEGFNTNALAEHAGIAVRSVYRYFPNKLAVIVALMARQSEDWEEPFAKTLQVLADPDQDVLRAYCGVIEAWVEHFSAVAGSREIRRAMQAVPELRAFDLADGDVMARRIAEALKLRGIETPTPRLEMIVRMGVTSFDAIFDEALFRHGEVRQEFVDEIELLIASYLKNSLA
jgi:AcrR family transcriptional regulator